MTGQQKQQAVLNCFAETKSIAETARRLGVGRETVRAVRDGSPVRWDRVHIASDGGAAPQPAPSDTVAGSVGISLAGKNVYATPPQDRAKALIYGLAQNVAFPVIMLVDRWHISEDTITKHARRHDALRYVEEQPGRYVKCVMHPDTASQFAG